MKSVFGRMCLGMVFAVTVAGCNQKTLEALEQIAEDLRKLNAIIRAARQEKLIQNLAAQGLTVSPGETNVCAEDMDGGARLPHDLFRLDPGRYRIGGLFGPSSGTYDCRLDTVVASEKQEGAIICVPVGP